jgi:hypothetical protein
MPSKKTTLTLAALLLILLATAVFFQVTSGPNISEFAHLRQPRLTQIPDQRVLFVVASGDPNVVAASAFKSLFNAYYKLDGVSRMQRPPAPRARWPRAADTPKDKWVGQYALPVPNTVAAAPIDAGVSASGVKAGTWIYGEVAEVLHVGPYSTEQPDIQRLLDFIAAQGYRTVGDHEEEYVKGPGMLFAGNPNDYLTIIRLRVETATQPPN